MDSVENLLRQSSWGQALSPAEFERVVQTTREHHVPAGGFAARMGETVEHWTGLVGGLLKMQVASADGRVSTLTGLSAGGWYGEGSLLKREPRRYDVVALRESRLALVPHATFDWLRQTSLPFNHYLQGLMNARLSLFIGLLEYGRLLDTDARVARCLASLFDADLYPARDPFVDLSQTEIGLLAGLSRQRANQALHTLQGLGLVGVEPRGVRVTNLAGLRNFAGVD